ncbi:MAG: cytochrome c biogenesis protein CcsA [Dehalococcoidales bacterium]|nr:cytochrome c biogenesis protein CcsA [Dehalococcoidales bacterium]
MKRDNIFIGLYGLSLALVLASLYLVFLGVPTEAVMGIVQRIFYVMVPMGWLSMLSFAIIFLASIMYLRSKQSQWDALGQCAGQLGILFTTITLLVGSMWARPIWGAWWTWEPRLTSTLMLWLIYVAYFMVRSFAAEESRGAVFAAVVGIVGFIDVPIIALSTSLWRGIHPPALVFEGGLAPQMALTLMAGIFAYTAFYAVLLMQTVSVKNAEIKLKNLKESNS